MDLGLEGGSRGGEIVFTGTPTELLSVEQSLTVGLPPVLS
jgi:excinuclease UvrABC ATPase subunit